MFCRSDVFPFIYGVQVFAVVDGWALDTRAELNNTLPLMSVLCSWVHWLSTKTHYNPQLLWGFFGEAPADIRECLPFHQSVDIWSNGQEWGFWTNGQVLSILQVDNAGTVSKPLKCY